MTTDDFVDDDSHPLLASLRHALRNWFHRRGRPLPDVVAFNVTTKLGTPAYDVVNPVLHYWDRTGAFGYIFVKTPVSDALKRINKELPPSSHDAQLTIRFRPDPPRHDATAPDLGSEFPYAISDYARAVAHVLGDGWEAEPGFLGAFRVLRKDGRPVLRLWVDAELDEQCGLVLARLEDRDRKDWHALCLPGDVPTTLKDLWLCAERIADDVRRLCP